MTDCGKCKHLYEKFPQYDGDVEYGCDLLSEHHTVHIGMEMVFCPMNKDDKDRKVKLLLQTMGLVSAIGGSYMSQDPNDFDFFDNQSEPNDCENDYEGGEHDS